MMNAQANTYLYAVLSGTQDVGALGPIGLEGTEVYGVTAGDLTAAVSRVSQTRLRPERKHLLAHQAVLRRLMEHHTVLPAAYGLVARSDEAVRSRLLESRELFQEQLARVAGKVEMTLKVSWSAPDIFEYFIARHPQLVSARTRMQGGDPLTREERIAVGKLFEALRDTEREAYAERVETALGAAGVDLKANPPRTEHEVMNLSCLVPRDGLGAFEKAVEAAAAGFDDAFRFEINGPWAPYSFTELEISTRPGLV
jgi:hypothetical protein